jgi:hypothetical protein
MMRTLSALPYVLFLNEFQNYQMMNALHALSTFMLNQRAQSLESDEHVERTTKSEVFCQVQSLGGDEHVTYTSEFHVLKSLEHKRTMNMSNARSKSLDWGDDG